MARRKGPEKLPGETGRGVPQQEEAQVEAHESLGGPEVPGEPCGLELDWWQETWRRREEGSNIGLDHPDPDTNFPRLPS